MEEITKQETTPKVKKPIWKTILIWIVVIWAVLTLAGAVIELFMFFTVGADIDFTQIATWALAFIVVMKLGIIKYKK